jgi:hypothetical protein
LENFRLTRDLTGSFGEACGLIDALETCDPESGHVVAFVSKLERFSPDGWLEARANTKNVGEDLYKLFSDFIFKYFCHPVLFIVYIINFL